MKKWHLRLIKPIISTATTTTSTSTIVVPTPVITYISTTTVTYVTQYVPVPGRDGRDGKDVATVLMQQVRQYFIQSFLEEVQVVQQLSLLVVQQQTILTT
jgi:hypothetical protein